MLTDNLAAGLAAGRVYDSVKELARPSWLHMIEFIFSAFDHISPCHDNFSPNHYNFSPSFLSYQLTERVLYSAIQTPFRAV